MTENLYDALEICLQALEQGGTVESCLARFPALAGELRPILEMAAQARSAAVTEVPPAVLRRGKARLLQAAAELREQAQAPRKRWQLGRTFRLALASLAMIIFLLTGGTGLVNASSGTLPGDSLYPVKRGWEGVRLVFVVDPKAKAQLENEYEQERVQEINTLYHDGRMEQVNFQGMVEAQQADFWTIAGLQIAIEGETVFDSQIVPGSLVQVVGETDDGMIKAQRISLLATPVATFTPNPSATLAPVLLPTQEPEILEPSETSELSEPSDAAETPSLDETSAPDKAETKEPDSRETPKPADGGDHNNEDGQSSDTGGGD
jgi:hypothetical protein